MRSLNFSPIITPSVDRRVFNKAAKMKSKDSIGADNNVIANGIEPYNPGEFFIQVTKSDEIGLGNRYPVSNDPMKKLIGYTSKNA